ncbi:MAG: type II toxin-antitoxin system RelE/ParE family toxin [Nocardioidaceae bacterium]
MPRGAASKRPSSCSPTNRAPLAKKLVGGDGEWRVRTGDYRIVYEIRDEVLLVLVVAVGHRRDIYQRR